MKGSSTKINAIYKKGTQFEFLFCFTCNKAGNTRAIAPKESIYEKGWDEI